MDTALLALMVIVGSAIGNVISTLIARALKWQ